MTMPYSITLPPIFTIGGLVDNSEGAVFRVVNGSGIGSSVGGEEGGGAYQS